MSSQFKCIILNLIVNVLIDMSNILNISYLFLEGDVIGQYREVDKEGGVADLVNDGVLLLRRSLIR